MLKPTIFIASSEEAKPLAKALARTLREETNNSIIVREWWKCFPLGRVTLAALVEACKRSDFSAVFLTKNDSDGGRENCIFEAGMFNGVFGTKGRGEAGEARRCFLLTSLKKEKLLSDLDGVIFQHIDEGDHSESISLAASTIIDTIHELGLASKPELECYTEAQLMEWEQVGGDGNLSPGSEVIINLTRPIEVGMPELARIVARNLQANVHYKYFFSAAENLRVVAQLLHSVATANFDSPNGSERSRVIETNLARMQRQLGIWFFASSKPFEFCVHNADRDSAVCYLRLPSDLRFINWCAGDKAIELVKDMQRSLPPGSNAHHRVFRHSLDFDLYSPDHASSRKRAELENELRNLFENSIYDQVEAACFGKITDRATPAMRPRRSPARARMPK
jgi:hypothetical protein